MKKIVPCFLIAALAASGCAVRKPLVSASEHRVCSDTLSLTVDRIASATLHDITVIPPDSAGQVVHIGRIDMDSRTHAETAAASTSSVETAVAETAPPASGGFSRRLVPFILILLAIVIFILRK